MAKIHRGPRGGRYVLKRGRRVYLSSRKSRVLSDPVLRWRRACNEIQARRLPGRMASPADIALFQRYRCGDIYNPGTMRYMNETMREGLRHFLAQQP